MSQLEISWLNHSRVVFCLCEFFLVIAWSWADGVIIVWRFKRWDGLGRESWTRRVVRWRANRRTIWRMSSIYDTLLSNALANRKLLESMPSFSSYDVKSSFSLAIYSRTWVIKAEGRIDCKQCDAQAGKYTILLITKCNPCSTHLGMSRYQKKEKAYSFKWILLKCIPFWYRQAVIQFNLTNRQRLYWKKE